MSSRGYDWGYGGDDVSESLKTIMFTDGGRIGRNPQCDNHFDKSLPCPSAPYGVSDQFAVFDTTSANYPCSISRGEYGFDILTNAVSTTRGIVGVTGALSSVTQIETYPFCVGVPALVAIDGGGVTGIITLAPNAGASDPRAGNRVSGTSSQLEYCSRVTLELAGVGPQSYNDNNDVRHHFEYTATLVGDPADPGSRMLLTPIQNIYTFTQPISSISTLTFKFQTPDGPLVLPPDQIRGVTLATNGLAALVATVPSNIPGVGTIDLTALLIPGDRIHLVGVSAGVATPDNDTINSYLNRPAGLFVGANITPTTFDLDPNVTLPIVGNNVSIPSNTPITLLIAKNRFRAALRFRTVIPGLTNYIVPN